MTNTLNKIMHNGDEYVLPGGISNNTEGTTSTVSNIRVGTSTEYGLITPEEGQISLVYTESGGGGWQPGVNTIAYYPLTSVTTVSDQAGSYDLTNDGSVTFGTYQGIDCAYFNGSNMLYNSSVSMGSYPSYTTNAWVYIEGTNSNNYQIIYHLGTGTYSTVIGERFMYGTGLALSSRQVGYESIKSGNINGAWHLITIVIDGSASSQYVDGQFYQGYTNHLSNTQTRLSLGGPNGVTGNYLDGYISEFILEDKVRTAQEISDYYDQTKGDYGIS